MRPGTGDPVPAGEVGEVVVTTLNPDYPLVRFGTGDLSAVLAGPCPTGRTNLRIKGWLGRADQTAKVRGMFVHPSQVAEVARRHPEIARARLVIEGELDESTGGRKPVLVELNPKAGYIVGVGLNMMSMVGVLVDLEINVVTEVKKERLPENSERVVQQMVDLAAEIIEKAEIISSSKATVRQC